MGTGQSPSSPFCSTLAGRVSPCRSRPTGQDLVGVVDAPRRGSRPPSPRGDVLCPSLRRSLGPCGCSCPWHTSRPRWQRAPGPPPGDARARPWGRNCHPPGLGTLGAGVPTQVAGLLSRWPLPLLPPARVWSAPAPIVSLAMGSASWRRGPRRLTVPSEGLGRSPGVTCATSGASGRLRVAVIAPLARTWHVSIPDSGTMAALALNHASLLCLHQRFRQDRHEPLEVGLTGRPPGQPPPDALVSRLQKRQCATYHPP